MRQDSGLIPFLPHRRSSTASFKSARDLHPPRARISLAASTWAPTLGCLRSIAFDCSLDWLDVFEYVLSVRSTDRVDCHTTIDHRANHIIDGFCGFLDANVLLPTFGHRHFEPVLIEMDSPQNALKSDRLAIALESRWLVLLNGIIDGLSGGRGQNHRAKRGRDIRTNFQLRKALACRSKIARQLQEGASISQVWNF